MKPEDKQLLLADFCARLPYRIIGAVSHYDEDGEEALLQGKITGFNKWQIKFEYLPDCTDDIGAYNWFDIDLVKPYLRPMSSMTEEEARDIAILHGNEPVDILSIKVTDEYIDIILDDGCCSTITSTIWYDEIISSVKCFDYLNKKMFDFRGLIPKDLALSTEIYNPYKD